ncbi:sigma-70 family RNA polymerase sigma factor [Pseudofrankia sp. BMG5.37]|uniref:sigma-70 family RNA polymerase sigma factor n=1 Tax=Pseudofrankia sp. BMG5.37 TaxID=3050035 RepID=UPI00289454C5|nr:sigma-70 family RNA polymerase sigma factor [Pseudofrankia sp. BMG5.37]MDT3443824.1 sigma-70 family RNA polymerase sigma factor [Pseudofrankia sp. BMG5.37]
MTERADRPEPVAPAPLAPQRRSPVPADSRVVAAFSGFYREDMPRLVAFLMWLGAQPADAVEIAQDTMTEVFRRWDDLTTPKAWARTVASRAYGRRLATLREDPVDDPAASVPTPPGSTGIDALVDTHEVVALFAQLPMRQRQVMAWTFDGFTPAEISAELGLSAEAVRASLYKARATLVRLRKEADPR